MFRAYMRLLETRPYATKMVTSTTLYIAGDALAQRLDGSWQRNGHYDTSRGKAAIIWGGILFAPAAHLWYGRLNAWFPGTSSGALLRKVAVDQTVWAGISNAAYMYFTNLLCGRSVEHATAIIREQWPKVMVANYAIWPALQFFNFKYVPQPAQVPFINVCILGWTAFVAMKANAATGEGQAQLTATDKEKEKDDKVVVERTSAGQLKAIANK